jgi:glutamyl-tRNA reductase
MKAANFMAAGASHRDGAAALQKASHLTPAEKKTLAANLAALPGVTGLVLLSTCNRLEMYVTGKDDALDRALAAFSAGTGLCADASSGGVHRGAEAVRHLMEVAAGLQSEMIGETEILGQVKQAYEAATAEKRADTTIHRVFQKSFQAAKLARETSGVGHGQVSLGAVAAEMARRIHGDLAQCRVLLVGSGQVGTDVARALVARGVGSLVLSSRTQAHGEALAAETRAECISFEAWPEALAGADVAIFCTAAPGVVLSLATLKAAMKARRGKALFLLDLAVPRDVETGAGELEGVFLYIFTDLAAAANENRRGRMAEIEACRHLLAERAQKLWEEIERRGAGQGEEATEEDTAPDSQPRK